MILECMVAHCRAASLGQTQLVPQCTASPGGGMKISGRVVVECELLLKIGCNLWASC